MNKEQIHLEIERTAEYLLRHNPSVVVRYRLLRDVLRLPSNDLELQHARTQLVNSACVQQLASEQQADGGWGAFHSRSTLANQKIASTEVGVERAIALGLDAEHAILKKAAKYIIKMLQGHIPFPDRAEKNDRWPTGVRLFLASTLALIEPEHPILAQTRQLWLEIAQRSFESGEYREEDEIQAHAELTGARVKGSYLVLRGRYQINLLGSAPGMMPEWLENAWLAWLWQLPDGIGYLSEPLFQLPHNRAARHFDRWLASHELLARSFQTWSNYAKDSIDWLWGKRFSSRVWDFGPRPTYLAYFPLSDSWRRQQNRVNDWTTRILVLIRKY